MAKSARASTRKAAKRSIRASVFDPVALERTERLSQKLLDIAAAPKPISENVMEVDEESANKNAEEATMDVDGQTVTARTGPISKKKLKEMSAKGRRVSKNRRALTFPSMLRDGKGSYGKHGKVLGKDGRVSKKGRK